MGSIVSTNALDTYVSASYPSRSYEQASRLFVKSGENLAFVYFTRPFPLGVTVLSAKLRVRTYAVSSTGSRTLTLHLSADRPAYAWLTWNNAPGGMNPIAVTKSGALPGATLWEFDVTEQMQAVSGGALWKGWRFSTSSTETLKIYGHDGGGPYVPELAVSWSDAPDAPSQLSPSSGGVIADPKPLLRWDYTDVAGDTEMKALQVQIHGSESGHSRATGWPSPAWDSGNVLASLPQLDLKGTSFPGFTSASSWWSVRVRDGDNLWSEWSDPAETRYVGKATFTLVSPAPGGTFANPANLDDATPVVAWTLTGAAQTAYRVRVWLVTRPKTPLWDSGRRTSTDTSVSIPSKVMKWDDRVYRFQVDVWDDLARTSVPGASAAYSVETRALLNWDQALTGTDWLSAQALDPYPFVELEWNRDPAPDGWTITRDNVVIAELDFADTQTEDGVHRWVDRYAPPRRELRYVVRPRVNGKASKWSPPTLVVSEPVGLWLVNDLDAVCMIGTDEGSWAMGEVSSVHEPVKGDRVVQIRQGLRGYEGSLSGLIVGGVRNMEDVDAREARDAFLRIKRDGGATLTASTLSFEVLTADMVPAPTPDVEEQYAASFSFWQRDRFDWDSLG